MFVLLGIEELFLGLRPKINPVTHQKSSSSYRLRPIASIGYRNAVNIPKQWYNLVADLPLKPPAPLHPQTHKPLNPEDLSPLFPDELIMQEVTSDRFINIPDEVIDIYKLWRPTPLLRFVMFNYSILDNNLCRLKKIKKN